MLRANGFSCFTSRSAWRYAEGRIHVLNFQSFNSYLAEGIGCTTFSFALNMGCYLTMIPPTQTVSRAEGGALRPAEYECHLRGKLRKSIDQPMLDRRDIWYVDPAGENLDRVVEDAVCVLQEEALPWFDRLSSDEDVLTLLLDAEECDHTWGFGANPSPIRSYLIGYLALQTRRLETARFHLQAALSSGCFAEYRDRLQADLQALSG